MIFKFLYYGTGTRSLGTTDVNYNVTPLTKNNCINFGDCSSNELFTALSGDCDESREAEGWVVSSESCGFLSIGAQYVREVYPGEIIEMTRHGIRTIDIVLRPESKMQAFCIFEYVYFARADSIFEGQMVYAVRMQCGRQLAIEHPVEADIVSSVPESGNAAAHGFSRQVIKLTGTTRNDFLKSFMFRAEYLSQRCCAKTDTSADLLSSLVIVFGNLALQRNSVRKR